MAGSNAASPSAADLLEGLTLDDAWHVEKKVPRAPQATGGNFCVGYQVRHDDGRAGFCKALDLSTAFFEDDPAKALQIVTEAFNQEYELLQKCGNHRLDRVVHAMAAGVVEVPGGWPPRVNYIIFELASSDVRAFLDASTGIEIAARLRCLHHVATGIHQLHGRNIAHQDLKPSNVLIFPDLATVGYVSKVSDLGRATDRARPAAHDLLDIAGDRTYAPPEQLYGAIPRDFGPRRLACDLYQLGSLAAFIFTATNFNALLIRELDPSH